MVVVACMDMQVEKMLQSFRALVISGGSSGLGKSFVEHAYRHNPDLKVFNLSRSKPYFSLADEKDLKFTHLACDLSDPLQLRDTLPLLVSQLEALPEGPILLINNSGAGCYGAFPEPALERIIGMLELNMRAPLELTGSLLPLLRARGGAIINVASTAAFQPTPGLAAYGATKSFLLNWSLALGEELRAQGIRVLALCPGPTRTRFFANAGLERAVIPDMIGLDASEVVEIAYRALARNKRWVISGFINRVGAFLGSLAPRTWVVRLSARMVARLRPSAERASHG